MPVEDTLPVVSHLKALVRLARGDPAHAEFLLTAFSRGFPVVSQLRAAVETSRGQCVESLRTRRCFVRRFVHACPLLSQFASLHLWWTGHGEDARRLQTDFTVTMCQLLTAVPRAVAWVADPRPRLGALDDDACVPRRCLLPDWMGGRQDRPLLSLLLPGTHDSHSYAARSAFGFAANYTKCQGLSIRAQLELGVRHLDVRVCRFGGILWCAHGPFLTVTLREVLDQLGAFVAAHQTEVVFFMVKAAHWWRDRPDNPVRVPAIVAALEARLGRRLLPPSLALGADTTVGDLTRGRFAGHPCNVVLLHKRWGANLSRGSWARTRHHDAVRVVRRCIAWAEELADEPRRGEGGEALVFHVAMQATPALRPAFVAAEIASAAEGLRDLAARTNYRCHAELRAGGGAAAWTAALHCVSLDYAHPTIVRQIVALNSPPAAAGRAAEAESA